MSKDAWYGFCTRAYQPLVGCDMTLPCAKNCWARGSVARIVRCQQKQHPDRAAFFAQALQPGTNKWSGKVFLDEKHLTEPLRWRGHERVAVGYHGDWGLASDGDRDRMMAVMALCPQHQFFTLAKHNLAGLEQYLWDHRLDSPCTKDATPSRIMAAMYEVAGIRAAALRWPLPNIYLGISISNQPEADERLPHLMRLAAAGWRTWVSIEGMIAAVNLTLVRYDKDYRGSVLHGFPTPNGGGRLSFVLVGGESGKNARPFDLAWARDIIAQCREAGCPVFFKQAGRLTIDSSYQAGVFAPEDKRSIAAARYFGMDHVGFNLVPLHDFTDPAEWEPGLRVRQLPEVR